MIKVKAKIHLYKGSKKRQIPFYSSYRPIFKFGNSKYTSGHIILADRTEIKPGDKAIVRVLFLDENDLKLNGKFVENFTFSEGKEILGEGVILTVFRNQKNQDILWKSTKNSCETKTNIDLNVNERYAKLQIFNVKESSILNFMNVEALMHFNNYKTCDTDKNKLTLLNPSSWKVQHQSLQDQPNPKLNHFKINNYDILCEYCEFE